MITVTRCSWAAGLVLFLTSLSAAGDSPAVAIKSDRTTAPLRRDELPEHDRGRLETRRPYERGKVPVVFIHGLWGSPRNWDRMIEDLDGEHAGYGAFWGEVQSNVHKALGCLGTVTNGSIRDIPMIPAGFQMLAGSIGPSHAYVHVVEFGGAVNVHGMAARSGDLVHADRHGAVVVPLDKISPMMAAADALTKREARIIAAARAANAGVETIKAAMRG